jgi:quercetin dioxygenase-like cupin family protein
MAISHLLSGEVASLLPLGDKLEQTPTTAFFKDERLEVMRIVLPAGKRMPAHAVNGPTTVQCIEGEVELRIGDTHKVMRAGDLLYLAARVLHELAAVENSSLLVTIALQAPSGTSGTSG